MPSVVDALDGVDEGGRRFSEQRGGRGFGAEVDVAGGVDQARRCSSLT
jgi:hypothetical protein